MSSDVKKETKKQQSLELPDIDQLGWYTFGATTEKVDARVANNGMRLLGAVLIVSILMETVRDVFVWNHCNVTMFCDLLLAVKDMLVQ